MMPVQGGALPVSMPPPPVMGQPVSWRPILPPEITRKIRKWQWYNFAFTLAQLAISIAIIGIISGQLQVVQHTPISATSGKWSYSCLLATSEHPQTCQYAYSVASISIFAGFIVSMFQCLTLDCCGMGRLVESMFDLFAAMWWIAGASTITSRAADATMMNVPGAGWREAVVALSWGAAASFIALFVTNLVLTSKLGKAFKEVRAQQAAAMAAAAQQGVQLTPAGYPAAPANYPPAPGAAAPAAGGPPANYPSVPSSSAYVPAEEPPKPKK